MLNIPAYSKAYVGAFMPIKNYKCRQAVRNHNLITVNGSAALEFAKEILLVLKAAPENIIQQWYHFHELDYYNTSISYVKMEMRKNVN